MRQILAVTSLLLLLATSAGVAQQRLFLSAGGRLIEVDTDSTRFGETLRRYDVPQDMAGPTVAVLGGRYLGWPNGSGRLTFLDTRTGQVYVTGIDEGELLGANAEGDALILVSRNTGNLQLSIVSLPSLS